MSEEKEISVSGIGVSPGVAIGKVFLLPREEVVVEERKISKSRVASEVKRFLAAVEKTKKEVGRIRSALKEEMGEEYAKIFDAHLMILEDELAIENTIKAIRQKGKNAEYVFRAIVSKIADSMETSSNEYLRDRALDVRDVKKRVLRNLLEEKGVGLSRIGGKALLIAHDLAPSEAALMDKAKILGFATDVGGRTSHAAIMARARGIPAVVGLKNVTKIAGMGETAVIDGSTGKVVINPSQKTLRFYEKKRKQIMAHEKDLGDIKSLPSVTVDGHGVELSANMELPEDIEGAIGSGAQGIGLYRTEFFYLAQSRLPTEEEQYENYRSIAERVYPKTVIIRTVDVGGDKFASYLGTNKESNPFLGWRGIRFSLQREEIFRTQLRAIFRAGAKGNVKVMFPMVSALEELRRANAICGEVKEELIKEGKAVNADTEIGIMVETPSAVITSELLAKETDFFSIGTNDLIQYTLAVDRGNERIAQLYEPFHPAILRALKMTVDAAHANHIWVGVCGEMGGDPLGALLLVGMGVDELSVSPFVLPEIKTAIRSAKYSELKELAEHVLLLSTATEVKGAILERVGDKFPQFLICNI
ncbi:MAG: phosphoenolpyruvate--protein phosphotransferase [Candidatus Eisenbacteria bacterium]|nr:phosphoenolpyruvate--protein phosphotransferase [Candidatus Eisenbacteria bacterium]